MRLSRFSFGALTFLSLLSIASPAVGEEGATIRPGYGRIRGFFFLANGLPVEAVKVDLHDRTIARSDGEGMFAIEVEVGEHPLVFVTPTGRVFDVGAPLRVLDGQETEFVVTFPATGAPIVDVEAPIGAIARDLPDPSVATGTVSGVILANPAGTPVSGARVFIRGSRRDARSDAQGRFELALEAGPHDLTVIHPDYSTGTVAVIVREGEVTAATVQLDEKSRRLAQMVITAPRIEGGAISVLRERQESSAVADVLGADQISKAGDSDAASALSRVTGITVVGGRFVYVRGLGERYSSTLLNGSSLPSPDPERRVVPLDLFPASAIASLVVQKSYSVDVPGEFGGGIVQIRTKDIPSDFTLRLSLSGAYNSVTTLREGLSYGGGGTDVLGFGAGYRGLPDELRQVTRERTLVPYVPVIAEDGFTSDERERFAEMLDPNFGPSPRRLPMDFGVGVQAGGKFDLFGARAGAYVSGDFSNAWSIQRNAFRTTSVNSDTNELRVQKNQTILDTSNDVGLTGLAALGVDFDDDNQLRLTFGVFRLSTDSASETTGFDDDRGSDVLKSRLQWSERMVSTNQVRGNNLLVPSLGLRLDWRYQLAVATRDQPNRRSIRYTLEAGRFEVDPDGTERYYSELLDINHDLGADISMPYPLFGGLETTFKVGAAVELKDRTVDVRRFVYKRNTNRDPEETARVRLLPRDRIFGADTLEPGLHELEESTRSDDNYLAAQQVFAGYAMSNLALAESLTVQVGLRVEQSRQAIESNPLPGSEGVGGIEPVSKSVFDLLPAATATWAFVEDMQLRVGLARTVNRPSFRELSSAAFIDLARAREFRGNPELERADLYHADARWEWYPTPGESVSVAVFAKIINSPIENSISGGATQVGRPVNTDLARNLGVELEARKNFAFISAALADLYVASNLTLVSSRITIGEDKLGILTSAQRSLQGQSPYAVNAQIGYDNADSGTSLSLLFNVFGRRINDVGTDGLPDIFEEARPELSLVAKQTWDRFRFTLKVRNMLDADYQLTQTEAREGGERVVVEQYERGVSVSLGISVDLD